MKVIRVRFLIASICVVMVAAAPSVLGKSWKGISPLKTTRAEVIRFLGQPTGVDENQRAIFSHGDGVVKISWKRPDCISKESLLPENEADGKALVYQITLEPKAFLKSIGDYEKTEPPPTEKGDVKKVFDRWVDKDVSCLLGEGSYSCSIFNIRLGFGHSDSSESGVTAIYYFASKEETDLFLSKLEPCVTEIKAN